MSIFINFIFSCRDKVFEQQKILYPSLFPCINCWNSLVLVFRISNSNCSIYSFCGLAFCLGRCFSCYSLFYNCFTVGLLNFKNCSSNLKQNIENLEKNSVTSLRTMVNLGSEVYTQADVYVTLPIRVLNECHGFHSTVLQDH